MHACDSCVIWKHELNELQMEWGLDSSIVVMLWPCVNFLSPSLAHLHDVFPSP